MARLIFEFDGNAWEKWRNVQRSTWKQHEMEQEMRNQDKQEEKDEECIDTLGHIVDKFTNLSLADFTKGGESLLIKQLCKDSKLKWCYSKEHFSNNFHGLVKNLFDQALKIDADSRISINEIASWDWREAIIAPKKE